MRCDSCGTDNEPGSRFCGNCGAKVRAAGGRVAPTVKVTDQPAQQSLQALQSPPSRPPAPMPLPIPVRAPPSMPPPISASAPLPVPVARRPLVPAASTSLPAVRTGRRWGLVALLLVIDLGLAGAGAVLLQRGLAAHDVPSPSQKAPR